MSEKKDGGEGRSWIRGERPCTSQLPAQLPLARSCLHHSRSAEGEETMDVAVRSMPRFHSIHFAAVLEGLPWFVMRLKQHHQGSCHHFRPPMVLTDVVVRQSRKIETLAGDFVPGDELHIGKAHSSPQFPPTSFG